MRWLLAAVLLASLSAPAQAALNLCNRTSYILYAATAVAKGTDVDTRGWTRLAPGDCATALSDDLAAQGYFVYARTALAHSGTPRAWGGEAQFCARDVNFALHMQGTQPCDPDSFLLPFAAVDTHHMRSWTMTLTESPALATLAAARIAGLKRLLHDNGLAAGPIDPRPDPVAAKSVAQFQAQMHLPPKAPATALFVMLESEAAKKSAPAGYTVCNDTKSPVIFALAQMSGPRWVSHGWWTVAGGSCAAAITAPLKTDSIYLYALHPGGKPIVGGPNPFCVANVEFDIQNRDRCKERGLDAAGFAQTMTKGVSGYVAHIGETGLVAPVGAQPRTSK